MTTLITPVRVLASLLLLGFTDFGDFLESRPVVLNCRTFHAVLDNLIHMWIGILVWTVVADGSQIISRNLLITAIGSSFIDLDHFIAARSVSLDHALNAGHRGIFHCTGLAVLLAAALHNTEYSWLTLIIALPHHLRDAQRRGLYVLPFTQVWDTPPIPKFVVKLLLATVPWIILLVKDGLTRSLERRAVPLLSKIVEV